MCVCFVDCDHVPQGVLWGVPQEYGGQGPLLRATRSFSAKLHTFLVSVGLHQGYPLSQILFVIFMDRISRHSQREESIRFRDLRIVSLLFSDDVVLLASSDWDLQHSLGWFVAECEVVVMRVSTSKSEGMVAEKRWIALSGTGASYCSRQRSSSISGSCSQ